MRFHQERAARSFAPRSVFGLLIVLVAMALALLLSGCMKNEGPPTYTHTSLGGVRVFQPVVSDNATQTLDEYGLFYSTNRDDVVGIDSNPGYDGFDNDATIITDPAVKQVRVLRSLYSSENQTGTLAVDAKSLTPGVTYYYRVYTIGHDRDGIVWRTLFTVGGYVTPNPTLRSLKKSAGTLAPAFSKMRLTYTCTISKSTSSTKITVVPALSGSSVSMSMDGTPWAAGRSKVVSVAKGHNKTLSIRVIEPGGFGVVYAVKVIRKK